MVQRQRHCGALLDSHRRPARTIELTPCLAPLAPFRNDIHVITGLDNPAARLPGPGNDHHRSMSALVSGTLVHRTRRGRAVHRSGDRRARSAASRASARCRSASSQESFGESIQRNLSWAGRDRALPPEMIPHKLFDRIFGKRDEGWVDAQAQHSRRRAGRRGVA